MDNTILITDIGSTTTKAILLNNTDGIWKLTALANAPTTVEKPFENVFAGILNAVQSLQPQSDIKLITTNPHTQEMQINPELKWLSTSSAGGGLQILVIGLTKEESAASAGRAAYGVGGILLDTIAIDDGRSVVEQMHAIEDKQPDIILMSGGYEGGAYASILRQAEVLSYCEIKPKYLLKDKIPLIYAGNADAAQAIKNILQDSFEVYLLANIRPSEEIEKTDHVTELVHELFLNKVMQQAPGYKAVSTQVSDPIIPTPLGVMEALKLIAETENKNILAVDIGGATTDVYSNVFGKFYRTVSANYGMSYNICNVFAKADEAQLNQWLHPSVTEQVLRDFIANKMLYPTINPANDTTLHFEQALARIALQLSLKQHLQMNFSINRIGHFIKIKNDELDPFHEQFFREKLNEKAEFRLQDFDIIIGAGGVLSHAPLPKQTAIMLIDGLQPRGATEIWRDNHFITPHLGKLSQVNKKTATALLKSDCLQPLCLCLRPLAQKLKKDKPALSVQITSAKGSRTVEVNGNQLIWIDNSDKVTVNVKAHGSVRIAYEQKELNTETVLPILIDTRISGQYAFDDLNQTLSLYNDLSNASTDGIFPISSTPPSTIQKGKSKRVFALPYAGKIYVNEGDVVTPQTVLAENLYDPPRIFILQVFRGREDMLNDESFRHNLMVKLGDEVKSGQLIYHETQSFLESLVSTGNYNYHSPVRGKVEKIDWQNGTLLLREIQDYSFEPYIVSLHDKLGVKPRFITTYMHKRKGDYITTGEILAAKNWSKYDHLIHSPATGTIIDVDTAKGNVTIQYQRKNLKLTSGLSAKVTSIAKNRFVEMEYDGITINGSIGFGKASNGPVMWNDTFVEADLKPGFIAIFPFALSMEQLKLIQRNKLAGIIVPSLSEKDVVSLLSYELGVGLTGGEALPFGIILTNGFGNLTLSKEYEEIFRDCTGKHGVMLPATQIRAGVVRPCLIVQS